MRKLGQYLATQSRLPNPKY